MLILLQLGPGARAVRADSDGYYCAGPDYLAYQLRAGLSASQVSGHTLRVVRFGPAGLSFFGEVRIEDFQPHHMICEEGSVRIGGFSSRPVEYVIDVSGTAGPAILQVVTEPQRSLQRTPLRNLGAWAQSGVTRLPSEDRSHVYELVVAASEVRAGDEILHHRLSELVMVDLDGNVVQRLKLFDGDTVETID